MVRAGRTLTRRRSLTTGKVFYRVKGSGFVYAAVGSHMMIAGPLHGQLVRTFNTGEHFQWIAHDLTRLPGPTPPSGVHAHRQRAFRRGPHRAGREGRRRPESKTDLMRRLTDGRLPDSAGRLVSASFPRYANATGQRSHSRSARGGRTRPPGELDDCTHRRCSAPHRPPVPKRLARSSIEARTRSRLASRRNRACAWP